VIAVLLITSACGGGGGSAGGPCSDLNVKIFGGEACNQSTRGAVVPFLPILSDGEQFAVTSLCTATFVTVDDIVTSAHCILDPFVQFEDLLAGFAIFIGDEQPLIVTNLDIHPFYDGTRGSPFDIAMATLNEVPSPPVSPVPLLVSDLTTVGEEFSAFGFGTNQDGQIGELRAASLIISGFSGGNFGATLTESGASICPGDSGGPAIQVNNGVSSLIGVNSFGFLNACEGGVGNPLSGFVDIQRESILDFILGYAPDVALQ